MKRPRIATTGYSSGLWALLAGLSALLTLTVVACGLGNQSPSRASRPSAASTDRASLPPVSLPDLSRMDEAVQRQMREGASALQALVDGSRASDTDLARAYGHVGNLLLAANEFEAAAAYYAHAEALAPSEQRWSYYLGHAHMGRADAASAATAFERTLRAHPGDIATLVWLATSYLDDGRHDQADTRFSEALTAQPTLVAARLGLGRAALAKRDHARAIEHFEQALAADPRATIAHYPLAQAYRALGDTAKADAHLRQRGGTEVGPPDPLMAEIRDLLRGPTAEEERGTRALEARDAASAIAHFRKAVELAPENASARHKLGTALVIAGYRKEAAGVFGETIRRAPSFAQAHYGLGVLAAEEGRVDEAVRRFSEALRHEPAYVDARLQLGELFGRRGRFTDALDQYRQALEFDPRAADARFGTAGALIGLRRFGEARQVLTEAAARYPDQPRFTEALARLDAALGAAR